MPTAAPAPVASAKTEWMTPLDGAPRKPTRMRPGTMSRMNRADNGDGGQDEAQQERRRRTGAFSATMRAQTWAMASPADASSSA